MMPGGAGRNGAGGGPIPVHLLTGFLGSGKTTLLQRLLADPRLAGTAVLVNEFGEVALDHHLLETIDETVVLLRSGCLCCTVRGELADAILRLNSQRAAGRIPPFRRIVVETTGLADPYPAMSTLRAHPQLVNRFALAGVLTTVDAVNGAEQIAGRAEALSQIAAADTLVVTKTDIAPEWQTQALLGRLASLNPTAALVAARGPIDPVDLLSMAEGGARPAMACLPVPAAAARSGPESAGSLDAAPRPDHVRDHHGEPGSSLRTFSLVLTEPVSWTGFGVWLTLLLNRHGDRILRVKGILDLQGEALPVAIHGVRRLIHPPVHLSRWPEGERGSRLVFIVEGLDPDLILRSFRAFNRLADRLAP